MEQLSLEARDLVGENGQHAIHRDWDRIQIKSHQINTTIVKVELRSKPLIKALFIRLLQIEQQLQACITDWLTFSKEIEQLARDLHAFESSLSLIDSRIENDGRTSVETLKVSRTHEGE